MKRFSLQTLAFLLVLNPLLSARANANAREASAGQRPVPSQTKTRGGTITGQVIDDSGQPMTHLQVALSQVGAFASQRRRLTGTDDTGKFQFENLADVTYTLSVWAPGYIRASSLDEYPYYRIGDSPTLTMRKGGVITGSIRNDSGEPLVNAAVRALLVKQLEENDRTLSVRSSNASYGQTDDRGVYRLYGLQPGAYIVSARAGISVAGFSKSAEEAPTFFPSSSQDSAREVAVRAGQEITGIDITCRHEPGFSVSGNVIGTTSTLATTTINVMLTGASSGLLQSATNTSLRTNGGFEFHGVPDGDYFVIAKSSGSNESESAISQSRRLSIRGTDTPGVKLGLAPLGSVSGRIVLQELVSKTEKPCMKTLTRETVVVSIIRDTLAESNYQPWDTLNLAGNPNPEGVFALHGLTPGHYRIDVSLPNSCWFTKSITLGEDKKNTRAGSKALRASDLRSTGIEIRTGSSSLTVDAVLAEGAASVAGQVVADQGNVLPAFLYVYLLPADKPGDDSRWFSQTRVQNNGEFLFNNVAPGKYLVVARTNPEKQISDGTPRPLFWDPKGRALLRKEGLAAGQPLELQPYERIKDLSVHARTNP